MRKILDERERMERQQHRRLIITETLMFLSVILLVGFLTLVVMGYTFNLRGLDGSGEVVERTGLVQVSSLPTGATIYIDGGTSLLFNTNASRAVLSGEHEISLARGGFDGWKKTVNVAEGMIYRLNYPRVCKEEREAEVATEFAKPVEFVTVSPNNERMVFLQDGKLFMVNLNENVLVQKELEVMDIDGSVVKITTFANVEWSGNSERMLAKANGKWVVINVRDPKAAMWLSEIVSEEGEMKELSFAAETGERVLMTNARKELVEWSIREKKLSEALVKNVEAFDNDGERVIYTTRGLKGWQVRTYRVGDVESPLVAEQEVKPIAKAMRYFQEFYVGVVTEEFTVYRRAGWPTGDGEMEKVFEERVGFSSSDLKKRGKGMVFELVGESGETKVFDIEAMKIMAVDTTGCGWVDEYLRYRLKDGKLSVLDYDGLNERGMVATGVLTGRKVVISGNNRWLYYFTSDKKGTEKLVREKIN